MEQKQKDLLADIDNIFAVRWQNSFLQYCLVGGWLGKSSTLTPEFPGLPCHDHRQG